MRRRLLLPALVALVGLLAVPAAAERPQPVAAGQQAGTFDTATGPALKYLLYVPAAVADKPNKKVPLLVYLHGCNQNAADVAVGTRLQALAEEKGLLVLFPEQNRPSNTTYPLADGNGTGCWNWFHPDHQTRDKGEPATLAGLTRDVMERFSVDDRRVWLAGASAGADMATILAATNPDLYTAVAPIAGCAYLSCSDVSGAAAHAAMGSRARTVPTLVVQGTADMVNNAAMGGTALSQWLGTNDLADDGTPNNSVPRQPTATTTHPAVQGTPPGDPCVGNARLPCAGGVLGLKSYPYTVLEYGSDVKALVIHGANHAYTGGDPKGSFVDPVGPDLAHAMHEFFAAHPRR